MLPRSIASLSLIIAAFGVKAAGQEVNESAPLSAEESIRYFDTRPDLEVDLVLSEPTIRQPVFLNFDERGRMWVVNYLQYPEPAGLTMVSKDNVWRAVYDKVPPPPPHAEDSPYRGKDVISIHEDTDGDGTFDKKKVFVEGLSIVTSVARGRGGVWVLNPPYLLFYPDRDNNDEPDGPPEVHLSGFWLEDTHSVVNSLRWGPDGWLYAAQGSTVSGDVRRPDLDSEEEAVHSMGQNIWRYHPETRRYEIFAEGGGNAFGVEIDSEGRIFSGHNGGNTRGFHYVQGAYLQKTFGKHGDLSNPYAFGYFSWMPHHRVARFTHQFVIYEGGALPEFYDGKMLGVDVLNWRITLSDIEVVGSTFKTEDHEHALVSRDKLFRPVDIKMGPDGALYIADWYDANVNHYRNHEGLIQPENGRIFRLRGKGYTPSEPFDYNTMSGKVLLARLSHPNKWHRQTALRVIADRQDKTLLPRLREMLESSEPHALDALWAINLLEAFDEALALECMRHEDPHVRAWAVRLAADDHEASDAEVREMAEMAAEEADPEVRAQLACSARRLGPQATVAIVRPLLAHEDDVEDLYIPLLLWWALESKADNGREYLLRMFEEKAVWSLPIVERHILERLMKRFAIPATRRDLLTCARLLDLAPKDAHETLLLKGFEDAYKGRRMTNLPEPLLEALARSGGSNRLAFGLRQGRQEAVSAAIAKISDSGTPAAERELLVGILGELAPPQALPALLKLLDEDNASLRQAALLAIQQYEGEIIAESILDGMGDYDPASRESALLVLSSRDSWSAALLDAVREGGVSPRDVPLPVVEKIRQSANEQVAELASEVFPKREATTQAKQNRIRDLTTLLSSGGGDPKAGQTLFMARCSSCHQLFGAGGSIGPDLTSYNRTDVDTMLLGIVDPGAEIREGFENSLLTTKDGRTLTGFLADEDNNVVVLRGLDGQNMVVPKEDIADQRILPMSLMPEGLLRGLTEQQVKDFFAFLRSSQPPK